MTTFSSRSDLAKGGETLSAGDTPTGETPEKLSARERVILRLLKKAYPDARCALDHRSALELTVATILSAQCTDARVNKVTPALFARYPTAADYAQADRAELENYIRTTGFFRNKAKSIQGAAQTIEQEFGGIVPDEMEGLLRLPGVARKTANVVLGTVFGKAEGVVVDTHVFRLSHRLGLARGKAPEQVERELMALVPRKDWIAFGHLLIHHGRAICSARKPLCDACSLEPHCPKLGVTARPETAEAKSGRPKVPLSERIRVARGKKK